MRGSACRLGGVGAAALVAFVTVALVHGDGAQAYDGNSWLQFGPTPGGPPSYGTSSYDRSFVREWEANPPKGYPTIATANLEATKAAIKRYEDIVKSGGWKPVPEVQMQSGMTNSAVAALRERLAISGELRDDAGSSDYFDYDLEKAVKRYQASNGLAPTGIADKRTIAALNVPATARLKQLKNGLSRLAEYARSAPKKYVLVNIPAAQVEAVENGQVASRHAGVVGKTDRPTPLLRSQIHEMNFNPIWRLPPTVIHKDLIPKGREMQKAGKNVLVKYHIDAYDGNGRKLDPETINWSSGQPNALSYSQQPGKDNPLGFLKINFHNSHSVYMHDTPSETIFGRNFRAASSGCIRVLGIEQLATWLLRDQGWSQNDLEEIKASGERKDVKLKKPVPLYFVYITAWATEDGIVQFRRDLYQRDGVGATASAY